MFDCDGLLVDSSAVWARAFEAAAHEFGWVLDAQGQQRLRGSSVASAAAVLGRWLDAPVDRLRRLIGERLAVEVTQAPPVALPGVIEFISDIHGEMPLAVASNGPLELVQLMLERAGLLAAFETICTASQVGASKPDPTVYLEACDRVSASPGMSFGFEDSLVGAAAVTNAGMSLIYVADTAADPPADADLAATTFADRRIVNFVVSRTAP